MTESQAFFKATVGSEEDLDYVAFISVPLNGLGLGLKGLESARQVSD